ncbi:MULTISPECIES: hypothetical protein [Klebsiella/Raoultella group]|uniref:hypothetical protein n=1 Tax=Klebsiella/Raoultella group TaxID=2890311 RepID=UPI00109D022E|nr:MULTISPECIES: hypothetical protein [Klebsiella/Raoultella group]TJZ61594.1 hypothetical protein FA013_27240 [Raoultella planticola]UDC53432.1 hypothetical protein LGM24_18105 [Klebsiella quasipneumoniae subsp. quasipneumoniae]VGP26964.1 hypothetical protein SB02110_03332 [Klebsiella quasipneumoniae subsp. quasipneumoniae]VTN41487.1 Uncharacterised protein [Raoultella ornithinolytica]
MAKEAKSVLVDDLNAGGAGVEDLNAEDLNAGEGTQDNQQHSDTNVDGSSGDDGAGDDSAEAVAEPEFVVLKGNSIRHDGEVYRENMRIPVTGTDADRLLIAGVIADVQVLRQRVLSAAPAVSVTTE